MNRYQLESEICNIIQKDNKSSAHFIWKIDNDKKSLTCKLVTLNPRHDTHFLLCQVSETIKDLYLLDDLYIQILTRIKTLITSTTHTNPRQLTYVFEWNKTSNVSETITSYFSGTNLAEVIEKFYFEKKPEDVVVYTIRLVGDS
tara:strand:+ start:65 stop:496 length:432 start_codon:yes stop_codon:yes gene_type:complete